MEEGKILWFCEKRGSLFVEINSLQEAPEFGGAGKPMIVAFLCTFQLRASPAVLLWHGLWKGNSKFVHSCNGGAAGYHGSACVHTQ